MGCPLFVELCAGTAALSLRHHSGRNARPPVSRMGAKTGYADAILRVLGIRPGQGYTDRTQYLWCEPDAGVRLLLSAYTDRVLATGAADIIRGWKHEDSRALWERLRSEGAPKGVDAREVARWVVRSGWSAGGYLDGYWAGPDRGGTCGTHPSGWTGSITRAGMVARLTSAPTLPATIAEDARAIDPHTLPPGTVAYMDPPYKNTTGYSHDLERKEVVSIGRRWAAAGAAVCISEAEPIPELVADGWYQVEVTGERKGQRRTFSKQQNEWLTINQPPAWTPSIQAGLFE